MLLALVSMVYACGPFLSSTYFWYETHPDWPLEAFAEGRPGLVTAGMLDSFQVVNWRILSGKPLSSVEQQGFVAAWDTELQGNLYESVKTPGQDAWEEERNKISKIEGFIYAYRMGEDYAYWRNCSDDAFAVAAALLKTLPAGEERDLWVSNQDRVFSACQDVGAAEPVAAPPGASKWLAQEAAYQRAAWSFYMQKWDEAQERFGRIANTKSPKQALAALVLARIEVRRVSLGNLTGDARDAQTIKARAALDAVIADPRLASVKASAERIRAYLDFHSQNPVTYREVLAEALAGGKATRDRVRDFTLLMDQTITEPGNHPMIEWIRLFHRGYQSAATARELWAQTGQAAYLIAALERTDPQDPAWKSLAEAVERDQSQARSSDQPHAYYTLQYLLLRGELAQSQGSPVSEAVQKRAEYLLSLKLPLSSRNRVLELAAETSTSLDQYLGRVQVQPVAAGWDETGTEWLEGPQAPPLPTVLSQAGAWGIGFRMPLSMQISALSSLQQSVWQRVALSALTKAVLLGQDNAIQTLTGPLAEGLLPIKELLPDLSNARTPEERRFIAALALLRLPGSRYVPDAGVGRDTAIDAIDDYRDNFWCRYEAAPGPLPFLTETEKAALKDEQTRLLAAGAAPQALGPLVIDWARANPTDPRGAEALHRIVRAARFGCGGNGAIAQKAFALLHRQWPGSDWSTKTPYWYD